MHEHLDEMGIIHMNGRIYDPLNSRFMSADPTIPNLYNLQSFNRYSYVRNNPLKLYDPTGFNEMGDSDGQPLFASSANGSADKSQIDIDDKNKLRNTVNGKITVASSDGKLKTEENKTKVKVSPDGYHLYTIWTKLAENCNSNCIRQWSDGAKLFSYPSEGLKPTRTDMDGRPVVVYGTLPYVQDAGNPKNYSIPGGRVVQSQSADGSITNTTLTDHIFCCGKITRKEVLTADKTLYMKTVGEGVNVNPVTGANNNFLGNMNTDMGKQIFQALDKQLIKYMKDN